MPYTTNNGIKYMWICITNERGRKALILKDKDKVLHVRLPSKDLEYIEQQAALCGMTTSAYVRSLLMHFKHVKAGVKSYAYKQSDQQHIV